MNAGRENSGGHRPVEGTASSTASVTPLPRSLAKPLSAALQRPAGEPPQWRSTAAAG